MNTKSEFERSLKPHAVEEFLDYYFYRRLAGLLVPSFIRIGVTPDQITTLSLLTGLVAAVLCYYRHFALAVVAAVFAIMLDCCDGQVARLTRKTSPLGRIRDGFFDMIWIAAFWLALYFSGYFQSHGMDVFWLMFASAASMIIHCWRFDGIKIKYLEAASPENLEGDLDVPQALRLARAEARDFRLFNTLLALIIAFQTYFFVRGKSERRAFSFSARERAHIRSRLEPVIDLWSWLGEGHHNTLVLFGTLLAPLTPYGLIAAFLFILGPMNLWMLYGEYRFWQAYSDLGLKPAA